MKNQILLLLFFYIGSISLSAQIELNQNDSTKLETEVETMTLEETGSSFISTLDFYEKINPISPNSSELGRYGKTPIGLFTGTIQQNILLHEFKSKFLNIPIVLKYSSNGLIVDKSASWVGMDWILDAGGAIVRTVNGIPDMVSNRIPYPNQIDTNQEELYNWMEINRTGTDPNYYNDVEPDFFNFNFAGYSGQFILDHSGTPRFIPFKKLKIETTANSLLDFISYSITTPDGIIYEFKEHESSIYNNAWLYRSALYLTKIIHPTGDEINFHYQAQDIYNNGGIFQRIITHLQTPSGKPYPNPPAPVCRLTSQLQKMLFLDSITSNNSGKVIFHKTNRTDSYAEPKLEEISVYSNNNELIKSFSFHYQFPKYDNSFPAGTLANIYNPATGINEYEYRMFLDSIVFNDENDLPIQSYSFEYYNLNQLPCRFSFAQDHWGFFNGKTNTEFVTDNGVPNEFKNLTPISYADKTADWNYSHKGMLKKVKYPTGGFSEYFYEANRHNEEETGGCRVKYIKTKESIDSKPEFKTYLYSDGKIFGLPSYYYTYNTFTYEIIGNNCYDYDHTYGAVTSSSLNTLFSKFNTNVIYNTVSEIFGDDSSNIGKKVYSYDYQMDSPGMPVSGSYGGLVLPHSKSNNGFINGILRKVDEYDINNSLVRTTEYIYNEAEDRNSDTILCLSANYLEKRPCGYLIDPETEYLNFLQYIQTTKYFIFSKWRYISQKKVTDYNSINQQIITNYLYNDSTHAQLTGVSITNSDLNEMITKYYYPHDYDNIQNFSTLINKSIIAKPVDVRTYSNNQLISGTQTKYNNDGQSIEVCLLERKAGDPDISFNPADPYTFSPKVNYSYNLQKKIKQITLVDNFNTAYLWDATGAYVMAKVENAAYSQISSQDGKTCTYNSLTLYNSLKTLVPNAMITTYTYKPLFGMTSQTDPAGRTTYYEYDDFGRLELVRDQNNNIISKNEYHYAE
jgi:YD repeat-containing protein